MNIFEGSRRIAKLVAALIAIGFSVAALYVSPRVDVTYKVITSDGFSIRTEENCPKDSDDRFIQRTTSKGNRASITLCFPDRSGNWPAGRIQHINDTFAIPTIDEDWIDGQWRSLLFKELGIGF